jgi:hypothetical protein
LKFIRQYPILNVKLAKFISTLGNPMILGLLFGAFVQYSNTEPEAYKHLPLLFAVLVLIPISAFVVLNVYRKRYTNLDVSDQKQRNSLYVFAIFCFVLMASFMVIKGYPLKALLLIFAFCFQLILSFLINQSVKVSMHTSFNFLFAYLCFPLNLWVAVGVFLFGFINLWSRVVLGRHKVIEVQYGFILGNFVGVIYLVLFHYFVR